MAVRKRSLQFPETHWSLVGRAGASNDLTRQQALEELLVIYLPVLRTFLIAVRRIPPDLAEDLLQDFIADKVLARQLVHQADQGRGKFRSFLLKSLCNFTLTKLKKEYAARARAVCLDALDLATDAGYEAEDQFDREWVKQVLSDALDLMKVDCQENGNTVMWEVFRLRVVDPIQTDSAPADYRQIVAQFRLETPRQAINLLANAKRCFAKHLRAAVGRYVHDDALIEEEIADLRETLGRKLRPSEFPGSNP